MDILGIFEVKWKKQREAEALVIPTQVNTPKPPRTQDSYPVIDGYEYIEGKTRFVKPSFIFEYIPVIRKLAAVNQNVGLVLNDLVQLTNTGHRIVFDKSVPADQVDAMRRHLQNSSKMWMDGVDGINGIINKMISQIYIGGALFNEWVVKDDLTGVKHLAMVNPETARWSFNQRSRRYDLYQLVKNTYAIDDKVSPQKLVKLNPYYTKYFALNGDTQIPYGIPPFLTALEDLATQKSMMKNIDFIVGQVGLMGFLEFLMEKPGMITGENEDQYQARLTTLLAESKKNLKDGVKDGVMVGFKEDHEYKFNSTTKSVGGLTEVFGLNQTLVANGLKQPPAFLGADSSGSETHINIIFTKMLSQLNNVQNLIKSNLEFGFKLELQLAGFKFDYLTLEFLPSTITDDLKIQQSREIKLRNLAVLYDQGIISQETFADEAGYEKADQAEPRVERDPIAIADAATAAKEQDAAKVKDDNDRKNRAKAKPQPKRKDQDTRSR